MYSGTRIFCRVQALVATSSVFTGESATVLSWAGDEIHGHIATRDRRRGARDSPTHVKRLGFTLKSRNLPPVGVSGMKKQQATTRRDTMHEPENKANTI